MASNASFHPWMPHAQQMPFLKQICQAVENAGMDSLNLPDTVGIMTPKSTINFVEEIKTAVKIPIVTDTATTTSGWRLQTRWRQWKRRIAGTRRRQRIG